MGSVLVETLKLLAALVFGGAGGAALTEYFRRKRAKTQSIPLIERVNRNPVGPELRGIKLVRTSGDPKEPPLEIKNIREHQLTLRNTSDRDLRGAEIQFEFSSEDVEPWVSRAALSKVALTRVEGRPTEPWKKALRWSIPQFPRGDSVEFSFQVVDPTDEEFGVSLYNIDNVVLRRTQGEPPEGASRSYLSLLFVVGVQAVVVGAFVGQLILDRVRSARLYQPASVSRATVNSPKSPDEVEISRVITESQKFKYGTLFVSPSPPELSQLASFWVAEEQGGTAIAGVREVLHRLAKGHLRYGGEARAERFEVDQIQVLSAEFAKAYTSELWFLPVYSQGRGLIEACTPICEPSGRYELRKIGGRWLIQSEPSMWDLPDVCAYRRANRQ